MSDELKQTRPMTTENVSENVYGAHRAYDQPSAGTHHSSRITHHASLITNPSSLSNDYKQRAREQWSANPCGASAARDKEFGSREYFDAIEKQRYEIDCQWIRQAIDFDRYKGQRLLEVGFGTGTDLLQFARGGAQVTGVDLTPRSIEIARRRFEVYGLAGEFAIGDGENLSFPGSSFDVVYSFGVLHHTPDTQRAVHELHRVLKPGGKAIVMLYHRASLYYWGSLFLKHGVLGGEFFKESMAEIMSRRVEYSETEGRPLVKAYTRDEARRMFSDFRDCNLQVNQLTRHELRPVGRIIPEALFQWLARNFGWNILITATK
jgi:ubiquinone/menaquinone biosynthesis C-methylase UbiE